MIFILSWHTVAGIVGGSVGSVGGLLIIIAIVALVIFIYLRKRKQNSGDITLQLIAPREVTSSATYVCFSNYNNIISCDLKLHWRKKMFMFPAILNARTHTSHSGNQ